MTAGSGADSPGRQTPVPGARTGSGVPRGTVAVLDDNALFVDGLRRFLEAEGFAVRVAREASELEAVLADDLVDVLLADSRLPDGADGWKEARVAASRHARVQVVPMSGYDPEAIRMTGGTLVEGAVQKDLVAVVAAIESALLAQEGGSPD